MTNDTLERTERALSRHRAFERRDEREYVATDTPFEGVVEASESPDGATVRVTVRVPTLNDVVEGEVADVVEDGWFETLERRLADAPTVAETDATPPTVERDDSQVVVSVGFERAGPETVADDALAVVDYVEGTWLQGIIPGYEYGEPAAGMLERAERGGDGSP